MSDVEVQLPDGSRRSLPDGSSSLDLAGAIGKRLAKDAVARQDADNKNGDLAAKTALVASAKANVDRLQALESFKRIIAPFDGVVTTRATDIGALISVGGPTDVPLFTVADERKLRIYVQVPQSYSAAIKPGTTKPGPGKARAANAAPPIRSRTAAVCTRASSNRKALMMCVFSTGVWLFQNSAACV